MILAYLESVERLHLPIALDCEEVRNIRAFLG